MADTLTRLPEMERRAIQAEIRSWLEELKRQKAAGERDSAGQTDIAHALGFTQGSVHKALKADCGAGFRDALLRARRTTMPELMTKHRLGSGQMPIVRPPPPHVLERIEERYRELAVTVVAILIKRDWPEAAAWDAMAVTRLHGPADQLSPIAVANQAELALRGDRGPEPGRPVDNGPKPGRKSKPPSSGGQR